METVIVEMRIYKYGHIPFVGEDKSEIIRKMSSTIPTNKREEEFFISKAHENLEILLNEYFKIERQNHGNSQESD